MYFYYVQSGNTKHSCGRHATLSARNFKKVNIYIYIYIYIHIYTYIYIYMHTVYTSMCTYSYKWYINIQTNLLLLAIPSGMRIIFQPLSLFPRLGKYFQFLYKKEKRNEQKRKEKERKENKLYVSWLPLANKSNLSQGDIASLYVVFVMLT